MQMFCVRCDQKQEIIVLPAGPHLKAICAKCNSYLKFLSKDEKRELEREEDASI